MSLYKRTGSRYWWMYLEPARKRVSTKFVIQAASPEQSRRNKAMAEALYHKTIADQHGLKHGLVEKPAITFKAYAAWYRKNISARKRGVEREGFALEQLVKDLGPHLLHTIDKSMVQEWSATRARSVSVGTVNRELDVLKHMLITAVPKYLAASPSLGLPRLRAKRGQKARPIAILTAEHETKLLAVLKPADKALVLLALCTLFRLGDLLDLRWSDCHETWIEATDPKSGIPVRVPLALRARAALAEIRGHKNAVYVFPKHRQGTAAERRNRIKQMLRRACERAKVPYGRVKGGLTFHSFRHTGATRMLSAGVDPRTVQELGGWSSLSQVMRYTHPTDAAKRDAVERI